MATQRSSINLGHGGNSTARGRTFDSNGGFFLPDGSFLSPDAAYVTAEQLQGISKEELHRFLHFAPAFVIELLSYSDSLLKTKEKMECWMTNDAQLAWLINPYQREVLVYQQGHAPVLEAGDRGQRNRPGCRFCARSRSRVGSL